MVNMTRFVTKLITKIWQGMAVTILLLSLGSLVSDRAINSWLLDLTTHFKVQYLAGGICVAFYALWRQHRGWAVVSLLIIMLNLPAIVPWYLPLKSSPSSAHSLRVMTLNVKINNQNYRKTLDLVHAERPDLLAITEINHRWLQALQPLTSRFLYRLKSPAAETSGTVLYSRFPLSEIQLPKSENSRAMRSRIIAKADINGATLTIAALHPPPPISQKLTAERDRELAIVADYLKQVTAQQGRAIAIGDLNTTPWSPSYQRFEQVSGLYNARQGFGILPTWMADLPFLLRIPIDHCLVSSTITISQTWVGSDIGSDHLPLIVDLKDAVFSAQTGSLKQEIADYN